MKKKILLAITINPYDAKKYYFPPLGLGYLVSSLKESFGDEFEFKIITENFYKEFKNFSPDIVGISSMSQNFNMAKEYAKHSKENGALVIVGGVHISTLPSSLTEYMDVGIVGEGEETIVELVGADLRVCPNEKDEHIGSPLQSIKGIIYREDDKIIQTEKRPLLDVNKIPHPDRKLLNDKINCLIFSSRGCPFHCSYCSSPLVWDKARLFSPAYILEEIKDIFSRSIKFITFADYLLALNKKRLREIINLLKKEKILGKINFSCSTISNLIDEETGELFKEMGIVSVSMSLISGVDSILKSIAGNPCSLQAHKKAIKIFKKNKISIYVSFVIGLPEEKEENIKETLNFIKSNNLNYFDVYLPTPYPGTPLWLQALERKLVQNDMDWDKLNGSFYNWKKTVIISSKLSREKLHKISLKFKSWKIILNIKNLLSKILREG